MSNKDQIKEFAAEISVIGEEMIDLAMKLERVHVRLRQFAMFDKPAKVINAVRALPVEDSGKRVSKETNSRKRIMWPEIVELILEHVRADGATGPSRLADFLKAQGKMRNRSSCSGYLGKMVKEGFLVRVSSGWYKAK